MTIELYQKVIGAVAQMVKSSRHLTGGQRTFDFFGVPSRLAIRLSPSAIAALEKKMPPVTIPANVTVGKFPSYLHGLPVRIDNSGDENQPPVSLIFEPLFAYTSKKGNKQCQA